MMHKFFEELTGPDLQQSLIENQPDAIIDWTLIWRYDYGLNRSNINIFHQLDPMYYTMFDLRDVIMDMRQQRHQTLTEDDVDRLGLDPETTEEHLSRNLARGVWRVMVARLHPEWLAEPEKYYLPTETFGVVYDHVSDRTMRRRIIDRSVINDESLFGLYVEMEAHGMKGVGPAGRDHLTTMLAEEHPELFARVLQLEN